MNPRNNLAVLFALLGLFLTHTNAQHRIIGGRTTHIEKTEHIVAIFHTNLNDYRCVGSLVNSNSVVTACICVKSTDPQVYHIVAGVTKLMDAKRGQGQERFVLNIYRRGDIAVLKVNDIFHEIGNVKPISLCNAELEPGEMMQISGWGSTIPGSTTPYLRLKTKSVKILTTEECRAANRREQEEMPETSMCAGCGENIGHADYGAGGVVGGRLCAVAQLPYIWDHQPDLYTNISIKEVQDFIRSKMNNN